MVTHMSAQPCFNTQPPEGGWLADRQQKQKMTVSTHSRPKAAGGRLKPLLMRLKVSTHSRPKAAGRATTASRTAASRFNTQPPEGGWDWNLTNRFYSNLFQHTAARRRLESLATSILSKHCFNTQPPEGGWISDKTAKKPISFNTQPPEGGWDPHFFGFFFNFSFNTQPPEGGWKYGNGNWNRKYGFQHTAARRRLARYTQELAVGDAVSTHSRPKAAG